MANGMEGVPTIPVGSFTTDPMFQIYTKMGEIETKVSDSIFENYKLQVAQTNDINNRAMQTAFHTAAQLDALKQTVNDANTQSMLAAERLKSAIQLSAAHTAEVIMNEGSATNAIIGSIDRENLNRELTDRATEVIALREGFRGWDRDFDGLNGAFQAVGVSSQIAALGSQLQSAGQGFVNTGIATDTTQTANPTNIA
jgi:hypothetical protein